MVNHGVFTHLLLEGLRGAVANKRGEVTWIGLASHVTSEVPVRLPELIPGIQEHQQPNLMGNLGRNPILGIVRSDATTESKVVTNSLGMKLVLIPAGEFEMGANESKEQLIEAGFYSPVDSSDEQPIHCVTLSRSFYMGETEVTVGQWRKFVTAEAYMSQAERDGKGGWGYNPELGKSEQQPHFNWKNTGFTQADDHPVVNVSWNDVDAFCRWLSKQEGKLYRLPTEAEWEYACRAGSKTRFATGDSPASVEGYGNFWDQSAKRKYPDIDEKSFFSFDDGWVFTAPVSRFKANAFGLHDMHGNVLEWCLDWYDGKYYARSPVSDPVNLQADQHRVYRGGCWGNSPVDCRSALRSGDPPDLRGSNLGFRLVRVLSSP